MILRSLSTLKSHESVIYLGGPNGAMDSSMGVDLSLVMFLSAEGVQGETLKVALGHQIQNPFVLLTLL